MITIKSWQDFLDSLSTAGGNIVTLFGCSAAAGILWMWCAVHQSTMNTATFGVFTGFTGALLQAQKGNSSRQQMIDRSSTVITEPPPTAVVVPKQPEIPTV